MSVEKRVQDALSALKSEREEFRKERDGGGDGGNTGGGQPPEDNRLEKRVEKLEGTSTDIQLRMVRIETRLESIESNMATHSDIAELSTKLALLETSLIKWFVGTAFAMTGVAATICFGLARLLK